MLCLVGVVVLQIVVRVVGGWLVVGVGVVGVVVRVRVCCAGVASVSVLCLFGECGP